MTRYKDPTMQRVYEGMLALAPDTTSELYWQGQPRRGAGHRAAFWDGYRNDVRSASVIPGTLSWACFQAGRQFAKTNPGIKDTEPQHIKRFIKK